MTRAALITEIENYTPTDEPEAACIPKFLNLLRGQERCFHRDCFPAHITASTILLNQAGDQILMNHHRKMNIWLGFGGHADGEDDVLAVALRETMEESGLTAFKPVSPYIADLSIHPIPENMTKGEPAHEHYDVRYILQMTGDQTPVISHESIALKWMGFDEALSIVPDHDGIRRLIAKAMDYTSNKHVIPASAGMAAQDTY